MFSYLLFRQSIWHLSQHLLQYLFPLPFIRYADLDLAIESSGASNRRIDGVGSIRRTDDDHAIRARRRGRHIRRTRCGETIQQGQ